MKELDHIDALMFADPNEITDDVIEHYERNPDDLDLIIDRERFNVVYLMMVLTLGLAITIGARLPSAFLGEHLGEFMNSVVLDVISEVGIAIFGGAIVAYLIESQNSKQFRQNMEFRRKIKAILEERSTTK